MKVNLRALAGNWDAGYALDKHMLSSEYLGDNAQGHPQFNSIRTEAGEATFQLKYRSDWSQAARLAQALAVHVYPRLRDVGLLVPMAASTKRPRQPVTEVTRELGKLVKLDVFENLLFSASGGKSLKDLHSKAEKVDALSKSGFSVGDADAIVGDGRWNALIIDDLYDTGASMEAACTVLRTHPKINKIYVATLTWK